MLTLRREPSSISLIVGGFLAGTAMFVVGGLI
jgi:hypothetical protein